MARFPRLLQAVSNRCTTDTEKTLIHVHAFAPISRMALLRDLVTSTLVYQPGAVQPEVAMMAALARQLPCYQINLGSDLAEIPPVVAQTIRDNTPIG